MHRFFVPSTWIRGEGARLEGDVARRVGHVLRMSPGDEIALLDNSGKEYRVQLTRFGGDVVEATVISAAEGRGESPIQVTLYQGMLKGQRFQWVLQKGTELGVASFVPLMCHRSIPDERDGWSPTRYTRWRKIIAEAAEQSGRCLLPDLGRPMSFEDACEAARDSGVSIIPWEREDSIGLRSALRNLGSPRVNIFIGPEGGFEEGEIERARSCSILPVSLGRRILRSETAGIAATAAILYEAGELGG